MKNPLFSPLWISYKAVIAFLVFPLSLSAQPTIEWQKCLGGTDTDEARGIVATNDGGFAVIGKTLSNNGDVTGNHGVSDFWVVKLNGLGAIQWQKTLGGSNHDRGYSIQQTSDGGYIVAGQTESNDGDVSGLHGDIDFWVVKLNGLGAIEWQKTLGGSKWEEAWSVRQTTDGGYIVAGRSRSNDGDLTENHGAFDFWVVKLDESGTLQWQKSLGGSMDDIAYSVRQTMDGGYIVTGESESNNGDASGLHGSTDYWVVKLSPGGALEWQKMLGSSSLDRPNDIIPTSDGGYIVVGIASWNDEDVTGNHGGFDIWAAKLNGVGDIEWQKSVGGSKEDYAQSVHQTSDSGYIIAGSTSSIDGDALGNDGGVDFWVVKLAADGELQWQKALGGAQADRALSIQQSNDGGFIVAGYTQSTGGDVSGYHGQQDYWVVKLSPESTSTSAPQTSLIDVFPNPAAQSITIGIPTSSSFVETATDKASGLYVRIYDLMGRELSGQTISNGENVDIANLPNGFYLVTATALSGKVFSGKFRKQE